jgi:glycosyltransferase involved in cell wall biosynthesis
MKISVIIPTYEAAGKGSFFLRRSLESVLKQTYGRIEIIVADHSVDDNIKNTAMSYQDSRVYHFFNNRGRGNSSINMNEGIKKASGDMIKVLHFDDFFSNENALQLMADLHKDFQFKWGAFGFDHLQNGVIHRPIVPSFEHTMGCPSTSFFVNDKSDPSYFDEQLIIINDHDMHQRLRKKYGEPFIIPDLCVTIGLHADQVTNFQSSQQKEAEEWDYFHSKQINS